MRQKLFPMVWRYHERLHSPRREYKRGLHSKSQILCRNQWWSNSSQCCYSFSSCNWCPYTVSDNERTTTYSTPSSSLSSVLYPTHSMVILESQQIGWNRSKSFVHISRDFRPQFFGWYCWSRVASLTVWTNDFMQRKFLLDYGHLVNAHVMIRCARSYANQWWCWLESATNFPPNRLSNIKDGCHPPTQCVAVGGFSSFSQHTYCDVY